MEKPTPQQLKEAARTLYGDQAGPILRCIETRENHRQIKERFRELKQQHGYNECVKLLINEFSASRSLIRKSIHKKFPNEE